MSYVGWASFGKTLQNPSLGTREELILVIIGGRYSIAYSLDVYILRSQELLHFKPILDMGKLPLEEEEENWFE
jgi:hypothetical protein